MVRVKTATGWMCLASDATHYYENFLTRTPFPIVVDVEEMLRGYDRIQALTDRPEMVIPAMTRWSPNCIPGTAPAALSGVLMSGPSQRFPKPGGRLTRTGRKRSDDLAGLVEIEPCRPRMEFLAVAISEIEQEIRAPARAGIEQLVNHHVLEA